MVMIRFKAHFDGEKLCPDEPVSLPKGVTLEVTASEVSEAADSPQEGPPSLNIFQRIEREHGLVEGPEDWAAEHDHYLYGAPKRSDGQSK
jgi:hypothetical protein